MEEKEKGGRMYNVVDKVGAKAGSVAKLGVGGPDTSVKDVDSDTFAGGVVKDISITASLLVGEAVEADGGIRLSQQDIGRDLRIRLNVLDLLGVVDILNHVIVGVEHDGAPLVEVEGVDLCGEQVADGGALAEVAPLDGPRDAGDAGLDGVVAVGAVVDDDVAVGDLVLGLRVGEDGGHGVDDVLDHVADVLAECVAHDVPDHVAQGAVGEAGDVRHLGSGVGQGRGEEEGPREDGP